MDIRRLKDIRDSFEDSFVLDVMHRFIWEKNDCFNDGYDVKSVPRIENLRLDCNILEEGIEYLLNNGLANNAEENVLQGLHKGSFYLTELGKEYAHASLKFLFDGGLPRWENLTFGQVNCISSKVAEIKGTFFKYLMMNCEVNEIVRSDTKVLEDVLDKNVKTFLINRDVGWHDGSKKTISLMHFVGEESDDVFSNNFRGYRAHFCSSLNNIGVWSAPIEFQRKLYNQVLECKELVGDYFIKKQV